MAEIADDSPQHMDEHGNLLDPGFNPSDATQIGEGDADEYGEAKESESSGYGSMKKAELQAEMDSRGLDYDDGATKADLVAALEADDDSQ